MNTQEVAIQISNKIADPQLKTQVIQSITQKGDFVQSVRAFHALYDCPDDMDIGTTIGASHMSNDRLKLRLELIEEETKELADAVAKRDEVEMADALGDILYTAVGMALELGVDIKTVMQEIQASNMTKLGADGKVIRREDGKVLKGDQYIKPNIAAVLKYRDTIIDTPAVAG